MKEPNYIEDELSDALDSRFIRYAYSVLEERALPDARDGLKPSQRRVLVTLHDLGLSFGGSTEKSAKICGNVSANYHPHGEGVVYPTMYRLVQDWVLRYPLLSGQGNFGNRDGDEPAAMRYTEAKLSHYGASLLADLSKDTVPHVSNYNEKLDEPTILPSLLPNLLVNGCDGIAVGWATKMLPHNLNEVVAAIKKYIGNPSITADKLIKVLPGPDFPTGGKLLGQEGVLDYYQTGHGKIKLEGVYSIDKHRITVTELPYQSSPAEFCEQIEGLVKSNALVGIADLKNLSSKKTGIQIVIDVAKTSNINLIVNILLKQTCLRKSISVNQTVLIDGKVIPDANIVQLIKAFVDHRRQVLINKFKSEADRSKSRIHILEGLISIVGKIDQVIQLIRSSDSPEDAEQALISKKYVKSIEQAKAVLSITLRQLTKLEENKLIAERDKLKKRLEWLDMVLGSPVEISKIIIEEQEELAKKLGDKRRTEIVQEMEEVSVDELVKDEQLTVVMSGDGYVKAGASLDTEAAFESFEINSRSAVLFCTDTGVIYQRKAYEIPQGKGLHASNFLKLEADESVVGMVLFEDMEGYLVAITENGVIKKTSMNEFITNRKAGIAGIVLSSGDKVNRIFATDGKKDLFITTKNGHCLRYNEKIVPIQGRNTRGSRALKLSLDDNVSAAFTLNPKEYPEIAVGMVSGMCKKVQSDEFKSVNNRQLKGYSLIKKSIVQKHGNIVGSFPSVKNIYGLTSAGRCILINTPLNSGENFVKMWG